ncbi:MAG: S41 family peptidase [Bdellovibrionales bacterium]
MRRLLFFVLFISGLSAGIFLNNRNRAREIYRTVCDLAEEHFYNADEHLDHWVWTCRLKAAKVSPTLTTAQLVGEIQAQMDTLNVSHFMIYSPAEDKKIWKGEAVDTGIRSRYVEDHLMIYKIIPNSPAAEVDLRPGDEIVEIIGVSQVTPWGAQNRSGTFSVLRGEDILTKEVQAREISLSLEPTLRKPSSSVGILEIPSFRSEYFEKDQWKTMVEQILPLSHVIIDIRENAGGNFVAMLRVLSTFHCGGKLIGTLSQPRKDAPDREGFDDNTQDSYQIEVLENSRNLDMVTYDDYGCFKGKVTVLISSDTASTAEIFAQSFFSRPRSQVWGVPTAGDVVLAVWFDLPALGKGYSISIPEAVYITPDGEVLENRGVAPQKEIYHDLKQAKLGKDTFIEEAIRR